MLKILNIHNPLRVGYILQRYFSDATTGLIKSRLVQRFLMGNWETQDVVQMAILYFVHTLILCQLGETSIPIDEFLMVEDGSYQLYPWGQIAFTKLINYSDKTSTFINRCIIYLEFLMH
ncbi:hypothetical protein RDI58_015012 [Solanum bulbocastanum]|uniref:DUF1985 domain-containing protein n=1 Tax=Solanum bulbocastanum TaxID=147425 RepID=A0AAN8TK23_SOLBU